MTITKDRRPRKYIFNYYISGYNEIIKERINNLNAIFERNFPGEYNLKIIDVNENVELAENSNVIVTPTLIKKYPAPERRLVGCLTDEERILTGLGIA